MEKSSPHPEKNQDPIKNFIDLPNEMNSQNIVINKRKHMQQQDSVSYSKKEESNTKKEEDIEHNLDEISPDDLEEFFLMTEEWSDTYIISRDGKIDFAQLATRIYYTHGIMTEIEDETTFNSDEHYFKKEEKYVYEIDPNRIKKELFTELLNVAYNEEKLSSDFYSNYKSVSEYLFKNGLDCLNKRFSLIKHCPPFMIFRDEDKIKDICVVKIKDKEKNLEYLLIIGYFQVVTFPCVMHYVKEFFEIYNKNLEIDDIYSRYNKDRS